MSKNLQKILAGSLATLSSLSVVTPVMGATVNVDELYKNAYEAMRTAEKTEKQADINAAMDLIWQLRHIGDERHDENLINSACTWSSLVDKVQHPKLVKIVDAILKAQKTGKQADINAAFATIEPELPAVWRSSYTSAIDAVQQELQQKFIDAVQNAENKKTEEAVEAATALKDELLTSTNKAMVNWAKDFGSKLDAIEIDKPNTDKPDTDKPNTDKPDTDKPDTDKPDTPVTPEAVDIAITNIVSIDNSKLKIEFKALSANANDITLNVVDNKGNKVSVNTETLLKGQTTATFTFHNYLAEKPMGVWTVNGVEVNLTERAFLEDVNSGLTSQQLAKTLLWEYKELVKQNDIKVKVYNINRYSDEIKIQYLNKGERFKTVKEFKDFIDEVNATVKEEMNEANYIKSVADVAKNGTAEQLSNVLQLGADLGYIKNLNGNWMNAYYANIKAEAIAGNINDLTDIQDCIDNVETTQVQQAIAKVNQATNKPALLEALQNPVLGLDNVKAENVDHYYVDKIAIDGALGSVSLTSVNEYIEMLNNKATIVNAKSVDDMLVALKDFSQYRNIVKFNNLSSENKQDAAEELLRTSYKDGKLTLTGNKANEVEAQVIEATNRVTKNITDLNSALQYRKNNPAGNTAPDTTINICKALAAITGQNDVSADVAVRFYENSFDKHGRLVTYTNYTDVRTALK